MDKMDSRDLDALAKASLKLISEVVNRKNDGAPVIRMQEITDIAMAYNTLKRKGGF